MSQENESMQSFEVVGKEKISDALNVLLDSQFEEILYLLDIQNQVSSGVPQVKRTKELVEYMAKQDNGLQELKSTILEVAPKLKHRL